MQRKKREDISDGSSSHSCTLEKELEGKVCILTVEQNLTVCDVTRKAVEEYVEREQIKRDCKLGIISPNDLLCKR